MGTRRGLCSSTTCAVGGQGYFFASKRESRCDDFSLQMSRDFDTAKSQHCGHGLRLRQLPLIVDCSLIFMEKTYYNYNAYVR